MTAHRHRAIPDRARTTSFFEPVRQPENTKAHGDLCQIDICRCGATRRSNRNRGAIEMGRWQTSEHAGRARIAREVANGRLIRHMGNRYQPGSDELARLLRNDEHAATATDEMMEWQP